MWKVVLSIPVRLKGEERSGVTVHRRLGSVYKWLQTQINILLQFLQRTPIRNIKWKVGCLIGDRVWKKKIYFSVLKEQTEKRRLFSRRTWNLYSFIPFFPPENSERIGTWNWRSVAKILTGTNESEVIQETGENSKCNPVFKKELWRWTRQLTVDQLRRLQEHAVLAKKFWRRKFTLILVTIKNETRAYPLVDCLTNESPHLTT